MHVVAQKFLHAASGIYRELLYIVYSGARVTDVPYIIHNTYIDCVRATRLCGARSGSPQLQVCKGRDRWAGARWAPGRPGRICSRAMDRIHQHQWGEPLLPL